MRLPQSHFTRAVLRTNWNVNLSCLEEQKFTSQRKNDSITLAAHRHHLNHTKTSGGFQQLPKKSRKSKFFEFLFRKCCWYVSKKCGRCTVKIYIALKWDNHSCYKKKSWKKWVFRVPVSKMMLMYLQKNVGVAPPRSILPRNETIILNWCHQVQKWSCHISFLLAYHIPP